MRLASLLPALLGAVAAQDVAKPKLPLKTSSRWILDADGARVKLRCINWAGHGEANVPEGLHKASVASIADFVRDQGFNCVRLTYSIDHALDPHVPVRDSFRHAAEYSGLAVETLEGLYGQVAQRNPDLATKTRQDVFGAASWCCNLTDGNGWWDQASGYNDLNSRYFNTANWLDGLEAMATWARSQPGVAAMSLRNEIRPFLLQGLNGPADDWYDFVTQGAKRVHGAHPDALVVVGGSQSATDLSFVRTRDLDFSAWAGKHVWEMHAYSFTVTFPRLFGSCDIVKTEYGALDGFVLTQQKSYTAPLIVSEFGVGLQGGPNHGGVSDEDNEYLDCLLDWMRGNDADWALWALQGTYYVRQGQAEYDEGWGLMNRDWNGLRNDQFLPVIADLFKMTQGP
ncbi:glycosyl hydrolase family 5 protein/cellulase [Apiospora kogelbergensis]|uniref:glycosyl hydrolase family 5 protein/cellulase n=1 Tax=Apiospora kogelbergensis TaxID=1337665 RepID=UPI00312D5C2A